MCSFAVFVERKLICKLVAGGQVFMGFWVWPTANRKAAVACLVKTVCCVSTHNARLCVLV